MSKGLSPNDIRNYDFPHQMRGYDKDEVREFLRQVATTLEDLKQETLKVSMERDTLRTQLEALKQFEDLIKSAAIDARRNADTLVANARREVNESLSRARAEAEQIVGSRKGEAERLDEQITRLKMTKASYQAGLKNLIESHLALIEDIQHLQAPAAPKPETTAPAADLDETVPPTPRAATAADAAPTTPTDEPYRPRPTTFAPQNTPTPAPTESLATEHPDPFGLEEAAGVPVDNPADFGIDWSVPDSEKPGAPANGIVVEEATEVTRKQIETFSTQPEPPEPVRTEEVNAAERIIAVAPTPTVASTPAAEPALDPELAAALESYQRTHTAADELTLIKPTASADRPAAPQPKRDQTMRATSNDLVDEQESTDKIRTQAASDEPDNTEHNLIDIDQPIGGATAPHGGVPRRTETPTRVQVPHQAETPRPVPATAGMDPSNIARELDEVAARFEEEMDRAAKS